MSSKKIDSWKAREIADQVANKAFEHLMPAPTKQLNELVTKHIWEQLATAGFTPEIALKLKDVSAHHEYHEYHEYHSNPREGTAVKLSWGAGEDAEDYTVTLPGIIPWRVHLPKNVKPKALTAAMNAFHALVSQRRDMAHEICKQIEDRSTAVVMKTWPEIAPFVRDTMRLGEEGAPRPVPFQSLLNKYLPALPAPAVQAE